MAKTTLKKTVGKMTLDELKQFIKQVIEEDRRRDCYVDEDGWLVFYGEKAYADYIKKSGKLPSKVKAYWIGEGGLKFRYSDYELTAREKRRLARAHREIREGKVVLGEVVFERLRKRGIKI